MSPFSSKVTEPKTERRGLKTKAFLADKEEILDILSKINLEKQQLTHHIQLILAIRRQNTIITMIPIPLHLSFCSSNLIRSWNSLNSLKWNSIDFRSYPVKQIQYILSYIFFESKTLKTYQNLTEALTLLPSRFSFSKKKYLKLQNLFVILL